MAPILTDCEAIFFRDQLRAARAVALQDAEGFHQILFCLERLGLQLHGVVGALGPYRTKLVGLAAQSPLADEIPRKWPGWHSEFGALYDELLDARNDALHQGAFARSLTGHAVQDDSSTRGCSHEERNAG